MSAPSGLRVTYEDGRGILRQALEICTGRGFSVADIAVERRGAGEADHPGTVGVSLELHGRGHVAELAAEIGDISGVVAVAAET